MLKKHYNLTYIINRSKQIIYQKKNPKVPWLTKTAIILLVDLIKKTDIGLEFGSGRSTRWFAERCKYLYSIEHNPAWFEIVKAQVKDLNNVEYCLASVDEGNPQQSEYIKFLDNISHQSIDFFLNDGKIRSYVAIKSLDKIKPGGIYILDNAERYINNQYSVPESIGPLPSNMHENWKEFLNKTIEWRKIWTTDGVSCTLILFKP